MPRLALAAALLTVLAAGPAPPEGSEARIEAGKLVILHPWSRATAAAGASAVGYLSISNTGTAPERLLGADCAIAGMTMLHATTRDGAVARMRAVESLPVPPGGTLTLAPGGNHLMLMDTKEALAPGSHFACTLRFATQGPVAVEFAVQPAGAAAKAPM